MSTERGQQRMFRDGDDARRAHRIVNRTGMPHLMPPRLIVVPVSWPRHQVRRFLRYLLSEADGVGAQFSDAARVTYL